MTFSLLIPTSFFTPNCSSTLQPLSKDALLIQWPVTQLLEAKVPKDLATKISVISGWEIVSLILAYYLLLPFLLSLLSHPYYHPTNTTKKLLLAKWRAMVRVMLVPYVRRNVETWTPLCLLSFLALFCLTVFFYRLRDLSLHFFYTMSFTSMTQHINCNKLYCLILLPAVLELKDGGGRGGGHTYGIYGLGLHSYCPSYTWSADRQNLPSPGLFAWDVDTWQETYTAIYGPWPLQWKGIMKMMDLLFQGSE